jgi:opacity protein-like surface antigen
VRIGYGMIASVATLLLILAAGPVSAEEAADGEDLPPGERFFYVTGGMAVGGYVEIKNDVEDDFEDQGVDVRVEPIETIGIDLRAGYRLHRNIATEIEFQWLSKSAIEIEQRTLARIESILFTGNVKGYILTDHIEEVLDGRFEPFLIAGVGIMHAKVKGDQGFDGTQKDEDFVARFGGGMDVYLIPRVGFSFDVTYVVTTGDVNRLDHVMLGLGVLYHF